MQRRVDRVQEAGIGVGRKVDGDMRLGRKRSGHFDRLHHGGVRTVALAGRCVAAEIHRNRTDPGRGHIDLGEVALDVSRSITSPQLDEGDAFVLCSAGREVVQHC